MATGSKTSISGFFNARKSRDIVTSQVRNANVTICCFPVTMCEKICKRFQATWKVYSFKATFILVLSFRQGKWRQVKHFSDQLIALFWSIKSVNHSVTLSQWKSEKTLHFQTWHNQLKWNWPSHSTWRKHEMCRTKSVRLEHHQKQGIPPGWPGKISCRWQILPLRNRDCKWFTMDEMGCSKNSCLQLGEGGPGPSKGKVQTCEVNTVLFKLRECNSPRKRYSRGREYMLCILRAVSTRCWNDVTKSLRHQMINTAHKTPDLDGTRSSDSAHQPLLLTLDVWRNVLHFIRMLPDFSPSSHTPVSGFPKQIPFEILQLCFKIGSQLE